MECQVRRTAAGYIHKSTGYRHVKIDGRAYAVHRVIWLWVMGWLPASDIDHRDGDKLHCAIENLRPVSEAQNTMNARRTRDLRRGCYLLPSGHYRVILTGFTASGTRSAYSLLSTQLNAPTAMQQMSSMALTLR